MFVKELSQNKEMIMAIKNAAVNKMPIYAECGGFMYLCSKIIDFNAVAFEMVGLVPAECKMNNKLQTVGYVQARALKDNILCPKNEVIKGHEFHFSSKNPTFLFLLFLLLLSFFLLLIKKFPLI